MRRQRGLGRGLSSRLGGSDLRLLRGGGAAGCRTRLAALAVRRAAGQSDLWAEVLLVEGVNYGRGCCPGGDLVVCRGWGTGGMGESGGGRGEGESEKNDALVNGRHCGLSVWLLFRYFKVDSVKRRECCTDERTRLQRREWVGYKEGRTRLPDQCVRC